MAIRRIVWLKGGQTREYVVTLVLLTGSAKMVNTAICGGSMKGFGGDDATGQLLPFNLRKTKYFISKKLAVDGTAMATSLAIFWTNHNGDT